MSEINNINKKSDFRALVVPLDWGLGHATRCIPIISTFIKSGINVIVAAERETKVLLEIEFPRLQILDIKGYRIKYQKKGSFNLKLISQIPSILKSIKNEKIWLDKIINEHNIDLVISDNRYGLVSKKAYCVFVTHQLNILTGNKVLNNLLKRINYFFIERFDECWIPDLKGKDNFSGILSHPDLFPKIKIRYVGILSRFKKFHTPKLYDFLFLISGPEPQRTVFENQIIESSKNISGNKIFVRGKPGSTELIESGNTQFFNHLSSEDLNKLILESDVIICRSGYSTIMDLATIGKKAILIPTNGQKEQEYLAEYLNNKNGFVFLNYIKELDYSIKRLSKSPPPKEIAPNLEQAITEILNDLISQK